MKSDFKPALILHPNEDFLEAHGQAQVELEAGSSPKQGDPNID